MDPGELVGRSEWTQTGLQLSCQHSEVPQPLEQTGHTGQLDKTCLTGAWVVTARICLRHPCLPLTLNTSRPSALLPFREFTHLSSWFGCRRDPRASFTSKVFLGAMSCPQPLLVHSWDTTLSAACVGGRVERSGRDTTQELKLKH